MYGGISKGFTRSGTGSISVPEMDRQEEDRVHFQVKLTPAFEVSHIV